MRHRMTMAQSALDRLNARSTRALPRTDPNVSFVSLKPRMTGKTAGKTVSCTHTDVNRHVDRVNGRRDRTDADLRMAGSHI